MIETHRSSTWSQFLVLFIIIALLFLIGQGIMMGILYLAGIEMGVDASLSLESPWQRQMLRLGTSFSHILAFTVGSLIWLRMFYRDRIANYLKWGELPSTGILVVCVVLLFGAYPMIVQLTEWNMLLPLPEWAKMSSDASQDLLKGILKMDSISELLMSIFLVGVVPAIGEELLYRGIIQNKLKSSTGNVHIAIFIASVLFSLNHLQLERFAALFILGMVIGYAYHYTRFFWVPVLLHFINNSMQVITLYSSKEMIEDMDMNDLPEMPIAGVIISAIITFGILYYLRQRYLSTIDTLHEQEFTA